ncbi:MAG: L,D-transpeptidase [Haloechinothrix sp.]
MIHDNELAPSPTGSHRTQGSHLTMTQDPQDSGNATRPRSLRLMVGSVIAGVVAVALILIAVMWLGSFASPSKESKAAAREIDLASLTESSTHSQITSAPADPAPHETTDGGIVHPRKMTAIHAAPNGEPIGKIGPEQLGDTWLPVVGKQDGWVQVLLPSKPNSSTGWMRSSGLDNAMTPYLIKVHLESMTMELLFEGEEVDTWTIGIGKPDTPTPTGRTFLLGSIVDPKQQYSPVILPLGAHSDTLDSFGGGPGTVAIHTWPTTDVLGTATSHGCIRIPQDALNRLTEVPLGTLVLVDQE